MSIPPRFMAELRDRLTLSEIIGRKVKLTRAGREYKACCPFHREKSPSFYINDDKQFYHCFGCGAHGDAVGFVMQHDNLSFIEAVELLAARAGLAVPEQGPQDIQRAAKEKSLYALMDLAAKFFEDALHKPEARDALQYISSRGMTPEVLASFRMGWSPADGQALRKHLKLAGYTDQQMLEAGVVKESQRGGEPYAFFRERIMFPVADRRGRIVAFGGRILPEHLRAPDTGDFKPPKYVNSGETTLFHKGRMLFSESRARQAASEGKPVLVVEGYVDVIACCQAGYSGAVAPLGTALTEEQIAALWKLIPGLQKVPVLCFDGDAAGRRAATRAAARILPLLKPDHSARIAFLPEGQDPDSLLRRDGPAALQALLDSALSLVDFMWQIHAAERKLDTPEDRAGLTKVLNDESARIADRTVQQLYQNAFRERLAKTFAPAPYVKGRGGKPGPAPVLLRPPKPAAPGEQLVYAILLAAVINHPHIFGSVEEELGQFHLEEERLDSLRQAVLNLLGATPALDGQALCDHLRDKGFGEEMARILSDRIYNHGAFASPRANGDEVLDKWRETWKFIQQRQTGSELRQAGRDLARELSEENEQKWIALHDVHRAAQE